MLFDTGEKVQAFDLMPFAPDGSLQPCVTSFKEALQQEIIHYRELLSVACLNIRQRGEAITLTRLKVEFENLLRKENPEPQSVEDMTLVPRFRLYSNEEHDCGRISDRRYADARALAGKLERYLVIRERSDILPRTLQETPNGPSIVCRNSRFRKCSFVFRHSGRIWSVLARLRSLPMLTMCRGWNRRSSRSTRKYMETR